MPDALNARRVMPGVGRLILFMKVILLASILIMIVSLLGQCSTSTQEPNPQSSVNSIGTPSPSKDSDSEEGLPAIPYEKMLEMIAGLSKQAGISNLREAKLADSETEIRIWKAFGLAYPRCFILNIQKDASNAFILAPKVMKGKAIFDRKGEPIYIKTALESPRSGWEEVISYLKEQGIDSSVKLSLDQRYVPEPDAEEIIIEVKTGSQYSMVHYIEFTESKDGKKALNICQRIENEFGKKIGCGS